MNKQIQLRKLVEDELEECRASLREKVCASTIAAFNMGELTTTLRLCWLNRSEKRWKASREGINDSGKASPTYKR